LAGLRPLRGQRFAELDRAGNHRAAGGGDELRRGLGRAHRAPLRLLPAGAGDAAAAAADRRHRGQPGDRGDRRGAGRLGLGAAGRRLRREDGRRAAAAEPAVPAAGDRRRADGGVRAGARHRDLDQARRRGGLMGIALLFGIFVLLLTIGVPVAFALAAASMVTLAYLGLPEVVMVQQIGAGIGTASLIAIPLFIFAGEIMMRGGISERLIALASSLVGRIRGGLGQVSILSSLFFGGVSGSAIADVSAVGGTMIPQMVKRGYDRDFAVNVSITAALVALLVPPSHNLILYSAAMGGGISIADLFAGGILPA